MTRLFPSSLALPLAFAVTLSAAGGIALFMSEAHAANAHLTSIRCFMGANPGTKHDTNGGDANGGWMCTPEQRSSDTQ